MSQVLEQSLWEIKESDHLETSAYPFDEPDSPDNIQFAEPTDPEVPVGNHPPLIKGASLPKLVERVTYDEYPGICNSPSLVIFFSTKIQTMSLISCSPFDH